MTGKDDPKVVSMWTTLTEHVIKVILYGVIMGHAITSALRSTTTVSYTIKLIIALSVAWMVKGEVDLGIRRFQRKLPPGYLGFPILREIKNAWILSTNEVLSSLKKKRRKYGTIYSRIFLFRTHIVLGGHDEITWLFNADRKGLAEIAWPPNITMLLGPGAVANQSGKYHRVLRRLLEPYFAPKFVTNYLAIMDQTTVDELDRWSSSEDFQSSEVFKMYAMRLFYASSFGSVNETVIATLSDDFKKWIRGFVVLTTRKIPGFAFTEAMEARDRILNTVDKLIDQFEKENPEESERAQTTIIGRLIYGRDENNNRMMTRDEMKDNILNMIFAGHDTTYASISTLLYHLSQNPDAMEALAEEVSKLHEPLNSDQLKNAPVLNACIHESWRVDPPVLGSFRKAVKELQYRDFTFEEGAIFNYSILLGASDENLYNRPDAFQMERFLPKDHTLYRQNKDPSIDPLQGRASYPIFGGGTHVCLGKAFAQLELRVLAARMFRHYKVEVRNPQKIFPVNGWNLEFKLTKRKDV